MTSLVDAPLAVLSADKLVKLTMSPKKMVALLYILVLACFSNLRLKRANTLSFLFIFVLFSLQFEKFKLKKVQLMCMGFKSAAAGW